MASDAALLYANAVQDGDCARIIAMTAWMQERLEYVGSTAGNGVELTQVRDALCEELQTRPVEGNLLAPEGIEDKYVFPPGAQVEWLRRDQGMKTLGTPVAHRTWVRVSYPVDRYAPRDPSGRVVREMDVGVSVSSEGFIVKAGIVGNLEVDRSTVQWVDSTP